MKVYRCCICHKVLDKTKPIRLVKQEYGIGAYKQYKTIEDYDFCKECYKIFDKWLEKHKEVN